MIENLKKTQYMRYPPWKDTVELFTAPWKVYSRMISFLILLPWMVLQDTGCIYNLTLSSRKRVEADYRRKNREMGVANHCA